MPVCSTAGHLRIGRFSEPGRIYLITAVVHQRQPFFADWCLGRLVVKQLREAEDEGCAKFFDVGCDAGSYALPVAIEG
jgi:hypothetical protein